MHYYIIKEPVTDTYKIYDSCLDSPYTNDDGEDTFETLKEVIDYEFDDDSKLINCPHTVIETFPKPGDIVKLKNLGTSPEMTVSAFDGDFSVGCIWFDEEQHLHTKIYPVMLLEMVTEADYD